MTNDYKGKNKFYNRSLLFGLASILLLIYVSQLHYNALYMIGMDTYIASIISIALFSTNRININLRT